MDGHYLGLDLGQAHDYTAIAIAYSKDKRIEIQHLERIPLRTEYPDIVTHVMKICEKETLKGIRIVADQSGVGRPIIDMFRERGADIIPVTITGGDNVTGDEDEGFSTPKRDLITALLVGLQNGEVVISDKLKYARKLIQEVQTFKYKISQAGHDQYTTVRESAHDDLILSVCLCVWFIRQAPPLQIFLGV